MELFIGGLALGLIAALMLKWRTEDKIEELKHNLRYYKKDNKELRSLLAEADKVIKLQERYINQIDGKPHIRSEEGSKCNLFTDF